MGIFDIISGRNEKKLAQDLAARLIKDLPPKFLQDPGKQLSVNKITRSLERIYQSVAEKNAESRMGFYRRAIFANTFKWALKEAGYTEQFIDVAVEGMIVELNKKK